MQNKLITVALFASSVTFGLGQVHAGVISSEQIIVNQQHHYNKQQVLSYLDTAEVQQKLVQLGVSQHDAAQRIANMTDTELAALNNQLHEMPAGGVVDTIITVLVVVAVLDLLGVTDVYPFIRPIRFK